MHCEYKMRVDDSYCSWCFENCNTLGEKVLHLQSAASSCHGLISCVKLQSGTQRQILVDSDESDSEPDFHMTLHRMSVTAASISSHLNRSLSRVTSMICQPPSSRMINHSVGCIREFIWKFVSTN